MTSALWVRSDAIQQLLNQLVDKLDAAERRGSLKPQAALLDERSWPALYLAERESEKEALWAQVLELVRWDWLAVRPQSAHSPSGYAQSPRVSVTDIAAVRTATSRPHRIRGAAESWRDAVYQHLDATDALKQLVAGYCIEVPGHEMPEVVERLNRLRDFADQPLLLREVSSRLFWGLSKTLDGRQGLVTALLGTDECPFAESPVQLQVFLPPEDCNGVLFIENPVSFEQALRSRDPTFDALALVYASGFKGSAARLRSRAGCSLFYSARGSMAPDGRAAFERWLFDGGNLPAWFWGDLDWSGMRILSAMKNTFPQLAAWQPGYQVLLSALEANRGHSPQSADKQGQRAIATTGCPYADEVLLPALRRSGQFVDQEQGFVSGSR